MTSVKIANVMRLNLSELKVHQTLSSSKLLESGAGGG